MSDEVVRFEASFILAPGWALPQATTPTPAGGYRQFIVDEEPSVPATKNQFKLDLEFMIQPELFARPEATVSLSRLISVRSSADEKGRLSSIAIRTAALDQAARWSTGAVGYLRWHAIDRSTGRSTLEPQHVGPLRVAYNLPSFDEGSSVPHATIILVPSA